MKYLIIALIICSFIIFQGEKPMAGETGHIQITEFSREAIPVINMLMEDLFCQYGVDMPYFILDYDFPDYSERPEWATGYYYNLDWGPWGHYLPWFNELLGLLFDEANLPRWQMPDFSFGSWDMFNSKINEMYEESKPGIFMHTYEHSLSSDGIRTNSRNGAYLNKWTTVGWNQENNMCVDSSHNVYMVDIAGGAWNIIRKWNKNGTLLVSLTTTWTEGIAIGPDGKLYTREADAGGNKIVKRNPGNLTEIAHMDINSLGRVFTFDPDGYFYVKNGATTFEKWKFGDASATASHSIVNYSWPSAAYANGLIGICAPSSDKVITIPTSLDEDWTEWFPINGCVHITSMDNHFIVAEGLDSDGYYMTGKYTNAGTNIWTSRIAHTDDVAVYGIAAYPF